MSSTNLSENKPAGYPALKNARILLFVNDFMSWRLHRKSLVEAILATGAELHLVSPPAGPNETHKLPQEAHFHPLPLSRKGINPLTDTGTIHAAYRLIETVKPDLIHNFTIKPVIYGSLAAQIAGTFATVNTITGLGHVFVDDSLKGKAIRALVRYMYRRALSNKNSHVIFQNPEDLELFRRYKIVTSQRTSIIPGSGVDPNRFMPAPQKRDRDPSELRIIYAGRLLATKGLCELAEAMRLLRQRGHTCQADLYGEFDPGNPASLEEKQVRAWQKDGLLEWRGSSKDMAEDIQSADIACLPSYREGLSRFLLEASACEKAIVTTDAPGGRDLVTHERNGLLVPPKEAAPLADALARLLESSELRERLGKSAREVVTKNYTEDTINRSMLDIYSALLKPSERTV